MRSDLASVALFAFKRPQHLARTLASLAANVEASRTELAVFCDAARDERDAPGVAEVRALVERIDGFRSVRTVLRSSNFGLARSIIDGVSNMLDRHGRVIVVEDDLLLSPHFLRYMNDGLASYAEDERVASIHGYSLPVDGVLPETYFLRGADCWGWATWSRAWSHFRADGSGLLAELTSRGLLREFDFDGHYPYTQMLRDQIAGRNDSWAVRWHASAFLDDMLTLYPGRSLVHNIGLDGSGTHSEATEAFDQALAATQIRVERLPIEASRAARESIIRYFRRSHSTRSWRHWRRRLAAWWSARLPRAHRSSSVGRDA